MWLLKYLLVQWHWKEFSYCLPQCGIALYLWFIYIVHTRFFDVVTDVSPGRVCWPLLLLVLLPCSSPSALFFFGIFSRGFFFFDIIKSNFSIAFIGCFLVDFWFILGNFSLSRNIEQLLLWVPPYVRVCVLLSLSLHNCTNWLHFGGGARGGTDWAQCGQAQAFPSFPCHLMSFQMLPAPSLSLSQSPSDCPCCAVSLPERSMNCVCRLWSNDRQLCRTVEPFCSPTAGQIWGTSSI